MAETLDELVDGIAGDLPDLEDEVETPTDEDEIETPEAETPEAEAPEADEADEDDEAEEDDEPEKNRVPASVVAKQRERAREAERRALEAEAKVAQATEAMQMILDRAGKKEEAPEKEKGPEPIDPTDYVGGEDDPAYQLAVANRELSNLKSQVEQLSGRSKTRDEEALQAAAEDKLDRDIQRAVSEAAEEAPDLQDAIAFHREVVAKQLTRAGKALARSGRIKEAEISDWVKEQTQIGERSLCRSALELGENPARVIYELAQDFGYAPKSEAGEGDSHLGRKAAAQGRTASPGGGGGMDSGGAESGNEFESALAALHKELGIH